MPATEEQIERLPQWAQREIDRLRRDLADARGRLAAGPESDTFADPFGDAPRPLGVGTSIEFRLGPGRGESIRVRVEGNRLDVMGGDSLVLRPRSSNSFEVEVGRL